MGLWSILGPKITPTPLKITFLNLLGTLLGEVLGPRPFLEPGLVDKGKLGRDPEALAVRSGFKFLITSVQGLVLES